MIFVMEFHFSVLISLQLYLLLFPKNKHLVFYKSSVTNRRSISIVRFHVFLGEGIFFFLVLFVNYLSEATYYFMSTCTFWGDYFVKS